MDQIPIRLENDRLQLCGHLWVSVNRSWQVEAEQNQRPRAAFKGTAPLLRLTSDGTRFQAAIAPHEAWWLGFESDPDHTYAVIIGINGVNPLSGQEVANEVPRSELRNFLLIPDQPWFDSVRLPDGGYRQLRPVGDEGSATALSLHVFAISPDLMAPRADVSRELRPQYQDSAKTEGFAPDESGHLWSARPLIAALPETPCARVYIDIVPPETFERTAQITFPKGTFDASPPPAPYNPLGSPDPEA